MNIKFADVLKDISKNSVLIHLQLVKFKSTQGYYPEMKTTHKWSLTSSNNFECVFRTVL